VEDHQKVILLDTHVLIWLASDPAKLSSSAAQAIRRAPREGGMAISAITLWELAWIAAHHRVQITGTIEAYINEITSRTSIRPITPEIAVMANQLPSDYSSDPCDCLIGATALAEGIPLVTKDRKIRNSRAITTIW
jgi:PIN domain nuclease of toxin-antitoxin system